MVEEVVRGGAELVKLKHPAAQRNGQSEIALLVALAAQRQKSLVRRYAQHVGRNSIERRRLVVAAVSAAQDPVQARDLDRHAQPRAARRLGKPRRCFVLVLYPERIQLAADFLPRRMSVHRITGIVGARQSKKRVVMLREAIEPDAGIVPPLHYVHGSLSAEI